MPLDNTLRMWSNNYMSNAAATGTRTIETIPPRTLLVLDETLVEVYCDTCDTRSATFDPTIDPGECPECEGDRTVYVPRTEIPSRRLLNEAIIERNGRQYWTSD